MGHPGDGVGYSGVLAVVGGRVGDISRSPARCDGYLSVRRWDADLRDMYGPAKPALRPASRSSQAGSASGDDLRTRRSGE